MLLAYSRMEFMGKQGHHAKSKRCLHAACKCSARHKQCDSMMNILSPTQQDHCTASRANMSIMTFTMVSFYPKKVQIIVSVLPTFRFALRCALVSCHQAKVRKGRMVRLGIQARIYLRAGTVAGRWHVISLLWWPLRRYEVLLADHDVILAGGCSPAGCGALLGQHVGIPRPAQQSCME